MNSEHAINFKLLLQLWLNEMEWRGDFKDQEGNIQLRTAVRIDNQLYDIYLDASDQAGWVMTCIYAPYHARTANQAETLVLLNQINTYTRNGRFALLPDNRIQYSHYVDFETLNPTSQSIHLLMTPALNQCARYDDALAAVAVGGRSAEEALAALDAAESEPSSESVIPEVPAESTMSSALH